MDFEIDRMDDTYRITLFPPLVAQVEEHPGLSAEETERVLGARAQHSLDIAQQLRAADARHARGTTERHHAIVRAWHRAQAGEATEQDVALLREELARSEGEASRTYLLQGLYLAGHQAEALTRLVEVLQDSTVRGDLEFALRFLPHWSPETYEAVSPPFLRGEGFANRGLAEATLLQLRSIALNSAGWLVLAGQAPSLLEGLIRIATDEQEEPLAQNNARMAIGNLAARRLQQPLALFVAGESQLAAHIALVRAHRNDPAPP